MSLLKLYLVTFNCGRSLIEPDVFGQHLLDGWKDPTPSSSPLPDLIILNLQEVAPLSYAFIGSTLVTPYFERFRKAIKVSTQKSVGGAEDSEDGYVNILTRNCGLTAIMVFARESVADDINMISTATVGVGVSEMGNKGAVGARLGWKVADTGKSMFTTFVSAHLAPFEAEVERRKQDYLEIVRGLVFTPVDAREWRKDQAVAENVPLLSDESGDGKDLASSGIGMYSNDTYLFFSGDLNYRTAITAPGREDVQHYPQPCSDVKDPLHYSHLLEKDQLRLELDNAQTLHGLKEQQIDFPPTYKYDTDESKPVLIDKDVVKWNWAKHRWPSWCDRILFASSSVLNVKAGIYTSLPLFRTSDHRPVALSAVIPLETLSNSTLSQKAPTTLDKHCEARRNSARRKELLVGIAAYLSLTWEGRSLFVGTLLFILGAAYVSKSMV